MHINYITLFTVLWKLWMQFIQLCCYTLCLLVYFHLLYTLTSFLHECFIFFFESYFLLLCIHVANFINSTKMIQLWVHFLTFKVCNISILWFYYLAIVVVTVSIALQKWVFVDESYDSTSNRDVQPLGWIFKRQFKFLP